MLTARCPSCAAELVFAHGTAPVAICRSCRSTVVRTGEQLKRFGRVASIARDLSPLRIGARGRHEGQAFEVVGAIRRGREDVRWNEWFLQFTDGRSGWLGEGHGSWQIYARGRRIQAPRPLPAAGEEVGLAGISWRVQESGSARVLAADGELPYPVRDGVERAYLDLRERGGRRAGTLDTGGRPAVLYVGEVVDLVDLELRGLRHIRGFGEDPQLSDFQGPEIDAIRAVRCPNCSAAVELYASGDARSTSCPACGTISALSELAGDLVARTLALEASGRADLSLELGSLGRIEGVSWRIIGALRRGVRNEWGDFEWSEYLLYNPYRGFRWLIEDGQGHWTLARPLPGMPEVARRRASRIEPDLSWEGRTYQHFQSGMASTRAVRGELLWQAEIGDQVATADFISPPLLLSREGSDRELQWSLGRYLPSEQVAEAFETPLRPAVGHAPHKPSPYDGDLAWSRMLRNVAILGALALALWLVGVFGAAQEPLVDQSWPTSSARTDVFLSEPFAVPEALRRTLSVEIATAIPREEALVHVALLQVEDGSALLPRIASSERNSGLARVRSAPPGPYVARVEVAKAEARNPVGHSVRLRVSRDEPYLPPLILAVLIPLAGPLVQVLAGWQYESVRWQDSDYGS